MANPVAMIAGLEMGGKSFEHLTRIADESGVNSDVFVDFGAVDLNVNLASALGIRAQVAGDAVVEAHADADEEVSFLNGVVHPGFAMHAHHAEVHLVFGSEPADSEKRHGDGIIASADELLERAHRAGNHDAVAGENDRSFRGVQHRNSAIEFSLVVIAALALGWKFWPSSLPVEFSGSLLRIFGDVDKDRAGTSAIGYQEGFAEGACNIFRASDHHIMFCDGHGDAGDIDLLKRIGAQDFAADLARNAYNR